ncbi:MAG: stage II sporulation protein R [Clostridia bacterium]|nr:stage II sporulation protein R [Clostridia bacterium]
MITLASAAYLPVKESEVYANTVRLHVIANSNSEYDQQLKYAVRDAILKEFGELFDPSDVENASYTAASSLSKLEETAQRVIDSYGADYTARAVFGYEDYPERIYETRVYPAGKYRSLRVILGGGEGKNWWCVLFPPLCSGSAVTVRGGSSGEESGQGDGAQTVQQEKQDTKTVIRFKLLELFGFY